MTQTGLRDVIYEKKERTLSKVLFNVVKLSRVNGGNRHPVKAFYSTITVITTLSVRLELPNCLIFVLPRSTDARTCVTGARNTGVRAVIKTRVNNRDSAEIQNSVQKVFLFFKPRRIRRASFTRRFIVVSPGDYLSRKIAPWRSWHTLLLFRVSQPKVAECVRLICAHRAPA